MSDAIRLTVVEDTPISLAVGEADPVARREIAELQSDVSGLQGSVTEIQGDVTTLQEDVDGIEEQLDGFVRPDSYAPDLTSGASLALIGPTATESTWAQRETTAVDGVAMVDAILGNTVVWNQAVRGYSTEYWTKTDATTISSDDTAKTLTLTSSSDSSSAKFARDANALLPSGHTYLIRANVNASNCTTNASLQIIGSSNTALLQATMTAGQSGITSVIGETSGDGYPCVRFASNTPSGDYAVFSNMCIFDLTRMFGSGNEPSTVAEFEALFPEPYYPYDAGSLLSVQMDGIETVGFNQLPEMVHMNVVSAKAWTFDKSKCVKLIPGNQYQLTFDVSGATSWRIAYLCFDLSGNRITYTAGTTILNSGLFAASSPGIMTFNTHMDGFVEGVNKANKSAMFTPSAEFYLCPILTSGNYSASSSIINPCLHLVWSGYRNGEYEPYWKSERAIPAATYFPQGMRSAGTVHDELTADAAIVRIGERAYQSGDESDTSVVTDGTTTYYALATPTRTAIDPPLNMSYHIERGGTESVMHTDPTAAPTWRIRYPLDLAATVMANVAPVEQAVATANHAVGDLLCIGWQLYRVTSAIAIGERIAAGTNVTATTVAAELASIQ